MLRDPSQKGRITLERIRDGHCRDV